MRYVLKTYRVALLILFVAFMIFGSIALYHFYSFIQPIAYVTQSVGEVTKPGKLEITITTTAVEPMGIILISPSGRQYTQSSRDVVSETNGTTRTVSILTADIGEWYVKYRDMPRTDVAVSRSFKDSKAAIMVSTKATYAKGDTSKYVVSIDMSQSSYSYTIKAVRRSDGFSLTSSGNAGGTLKLEPYPYTGVWDFHLNTVHSGVEYSTMFSYTFEE